MKTVLYSLFTMIDTVMVLALKTNYKQISNKHLAVSRIIVTLPHQQPFLLTKRSSNEKS